MSVQTQITASAGPLRGDHVTASYRSPIPLAEDTAQALRWIETMLRGEGAEDLRDPLRPELCIPNNSDLRI